MTVEPSCLTALRSLTLDIVRPGDSLPPEAWGLLTALTRLHVPDLSLTEEVLQLLWAMPRLEDLAVRGVDVPLGAGLSSLLTFRCASEPSQTWRVPWPMFDTRAK